MPTFPAWESVRAAVPIGIGVATLVYVVFVVTGIVAGALTGLVTKFEIVHPEAGGRPRSRKHTNPGSPSTKAATPTSPGSPRTACPKWPAGHGWDRR